MSENIIWDYEKGFGDVTEMVYDRLINHDIDPGEVFKEIDGEHTENEHYNYRFDKNLAGAIVRAGYTGDINDISAMALFLTKRLNSAGDKTDGQTVRSWLKAERFPQSSDDSRIKAQNICFALGMTLEQAMDFIENTLFMRAFNLRDPAECIAFFALNNGLGKDRVTELDERIKAKRKNYAPSAGLQTREILNGLLQLKTEDELEAYILENVPEKSESLQTAKRYIRELKETAMESAQFECKAGEENGKNSIGSLLRTIYSLPIRSDKVKREIKKHSLNLAAVNFPLEQEFSVMLSDNKEPTADMLRKGIILLMFYNTFAGLSENDETSPDHYERFIDQLQQALNDCALPMLHPRNPYDRIFIYSAYREDGEPASVYLETFREIIGELMVP